MMSLETTITMEETREISGVAAQILGRCASPPPDHILSLVSAIEQTGPSRSVDGATISRALDVFEAIPDHGQSDYAAVSSAMVDGALRIIKSDLRV